MKYLFKDLFKSSLDNQKLITFIDNIINEFVISELEYNASGNEFYGRLVAYYQSPSGDKDSSIIDVLKGMEDKSIKEFLALIPDYEDDEAIDIFKNNSYIEIKGDKNIFCLNLKTFEWKRLFVNVETIDGRPRALIYHCIEKPAWYDITDTTFEDPLMDASLYEFEKIQPQGAYTIEETIQTISEEQFFESNKDLNTLDEEQKIAVRLPSDANTLVIAGAGSGKTRCLVSRLAYLHSVRGIPLNKIVLLTFTNEIASEMSRRSKEMLEPIYKKYYPLQETPQVEVKTIDGFFSKLLKLYWKDIGFKDEPKRMIVTSGKNDDRDKAIVDVIKINGLSTIYSDYLDNSNLFERLLKELDHHMSGIHSNIRGISILADAYINYQLDNCVVYDFTSITVIIKRAICKAKSALKEIIENSYNCILIDEFQDISILQNDTFKPLYDGPIAFTFCGDDNQTIYSWRGSDNQIIRSIKQMDNVYTCELTTNYRSDPGIVLASNAVLKHIKGKVAKKEIKPRSGQCGKIHLSTYSDDYSELVEEIKRIVRSTDNDSQTKNLSILILTRNNVVKAKDGTKISIIKSIKNALLASNLKVEEVNQKFDLDNTEYRLFISIINVLINYKRAYYVSEVKELLDLERDRPDISDKEIIDNILGEQKTIDILYNKSFVLRYASADSFAALIEKYSHETFESVITKSYEDDEELFESLRQLAIDENIPSLKELNKDKSRFEKFIKTFIKKNSNDSKHSKERNDDDNKETSEHYNIKISTVHSAKGLGADIVFLIDLCKQNFPNLRIINNEYDRCLNDIKEIEKARQKLDELRNATTTSEISFALGEMKTAGFDEDEKESLTSFANWFEENNLQRGLLKLNPVSVKQFVGAYDQIIAQLDNRYSDKFLKLTKEINHLSNEIERLKMSRTSLKAGEFDYDTISENISTFTKQMNEMMENIKTLDLRKNRFVASTDNIRKLRKKCVIATSYISDIKKEDKTIELKLELDKRKEERINEETRLFYVSLTRAKKTLYLMYKKGDEPSPFIDLIPKEYLQNEKLLSRSQKDELGEQIKTINELVIENEDNVNIEDLYVNIKDDNIEEYIKDYVDGIFDSHPNLNKLTGHARTFLEYGLRYAAVIKMIDLPNEMPISSCLERSALRLIQNKVGENAKYFTTSDEYDLKDCLNFIRKGFHGVDQQPNGKYIKDLFKPQVERSETKKYLKAITIMNYFMSSNDMGISQKDYGWNVVCKKDTPENNRKLMVTAFELIKNRNSFIHEDSNHWPEDGLCILYNYYFAIIDLIL